MTETSTLHRTVSRGDYRIDVVCCSDHLPLYAGLVYVQVPGERAALLASIRALGPGEAYGRAHRWLADWTEGDYRVQRVAPVRRRKPRGTIRDRGQA